MARGSRGPAPAAFPRTAVEFHERFGSDLACREFLEQLRWPGGFRCPGCGSNRPTTTVRPGLRQCADCRSQTTVTVGTIFERTKLPLRVWFHAMWLVTSQKTGASALNLQRQLGLSRYETAWTLLHKLRRAMVRPGRERLSGAVEIDETFVGGREKSAVGRGALTKMLVAVAAEEDGEGIGRIRLEVVANGSASSLLPFVVRNVEPGSLVHTDGWVGYSGLAARGYRHKVTDIKGSGQLAHEVMPRVHRVASLLKRWWLGTHQGAIGPLHLGYYLDEFTFRFNRRRSAARGQLFYRLAQQAVQVEPVSWRAVADANRTDDHNL